MQQVIQESMATLYAAIVPHNASLRWPPRQQSLKASGNASLSLVLTKARAPLLHAVLSLIVTHIGAGWGTTATYLSQS